MHTASETLWEGGQKAGRGIAEGAERGEQHGQEDMNSLIGFVCPMLNRRPYTTWNEEVFT